MLQAVHIQEAFGCIRVDGFPRERQSRKWDIIDPVTGDRFPPKVVLQVATDIAGEQQRFLGGGWPTNDPLLELGFEIVLKSDREGASETMSDLEAVLTSVRDQTTKQRLINARLGQGSYRAALLEIWKGQCAISGCKIETVLRASHIKPWRASSDLEKLDPYNGLLLAASIDALFDKHLLTLSEIGGVLVSALISTDMLLSIGLRRGSHVALNKKQNHYMNQHRAESIKGDHGEFVDF